MQKTKHHFDNNGKVNSFGKAFRLRNEMSVHILCTSFTISFVEFVAKIQ